MQTRERAMKRGGGWWRQRAAEALALLLVITFALGLAHGGSRYTYCTMMGTIGAASCCSHGHRDARAVPEARSVALDCCKRGALPVLPAVQGSPESPAAPMAPLLALLPSVAVLDALLRRSDSRSAERRHERPPDTRTRAEARAQLMVFLT